MNTQESVEVAVPGDLVDSDSRTYHQLLLSYPEWPQAPQLLILTPPPGSEPVVMPIVAADLNANDDFAIDERGLSQSLKIQLKRQHNLSINMYIQIQKRK